MRLSGFLWLLMTLLCLSSSAQTPATETPDTEAVKQRFSGYLEAFNSGDAEVVGSFWAEAAVSIDEDSGERTTGRAAIAAGFAEFFADAPGARLTGTVDEVRSLRPEVVVAEGTITLFTADAEPVPSAFTVVLVKEQGDWLIESSYERPLPSPTSRDALSKLGWLVGDWRDQTDGVEVSTTVRWSANEAFLIRSFRAEYGDEDPFEGTQIIGWDPQAKQYRTWTFNSDGSFGEGTVTTSGDQVKVRLSHVQNDGSVSTETQVIELIDPDTMRVKKIGRTVAGAPVPGGDSVTVVRAKPAAGAVR